MQEEAVVVEPRHVVSGQAQQHPQHTPDEITAVSAIALFGGAGLLLLVLAVIWIVRAIEALV